MKNWWTEREVMSAANGVLSLLASLGAARAGSEGGLRVREEFRDERGLGGSRKLRLRDIQGDVVVETWERDQIKVEAEKLADTAEQMQQIAIQITSEGDTVCVETQLPTRRGTGILGWSNETLGRVNYAVWVPPSLEVEIEGVNGSVRVRGPLRTVDVRTVNGSVDIDAVVDQVRAATTNGSVSVAFQSAPSGGAQLASMNGSVRLVIPRGTEGEFIANAGNGSVEADLPSESERRSSRSTLRTRIGASAARFELQTLNGGVILQTRG
jgi:DUF4097 and DUF4098 domain-containing protein YvlB